MSGWDPMAELGASLEAIDDKKKRGITVPPPPTDDYTAEVDRPEVPEDQDATVVVTPEPQDSPAVSSEPAQVSLPARSRGRGLSIRRPNGPMKAISADLPAHLVQLVTELRLDADVEGKPFKLTELLSSALLDLPTKASSLAALIDRYSAQFNYDRTSRDEGFVVEARLSTQITPDADKRVATAVRSLFQEYGVKVSRKDLYAVALLKALSERS